MTKAKNIAYIFAFISLLLAQGITKQLYPKPTLTVSKQKDSLNFDEQFVKYTKLGHGRFLGAINWVITLIEGDIEHFKEKDGNSWMFHRFKAISIYDPLFYENYLYGGQYLSIIKDDIAGASEIFDLGLIKYPNDFWLNYHAGFHFYFEERNRQKAIKAYEVISKNPITMKVFPFLPSILAKLYSEAGNLTEGFASLNEVYNSLEDNNPYKAHFHKTLYTIKAKLDLKCLNEAGSQGCEQKDFDGQPYIIKEGSYTTYKSLSPLKLKIKN